MRRSFRRLVALTALLFWLVPSTAHAANEMGLSWDGGTWSGQLTGPMFDPALLWVPGDVETKTFHVRNGADSGANLTIELITQDDDGLLRNADVALSARVGAEDWVDLERTEENFQLNRDALPAGESRTVDVRTRFNFDSPNRSQRKNVSLQFRVTLSEAQTVPEVPGDPGDVDPAPPVAVDPDDVNAGTDTKPKDSLPNAGAPTIGWAIVAAGILIGAGLTLISRRTREDTGHDM